jgi:hypothetical protein
MTMPHLMNCSHQDQGWCLGCVKEEWERTQRLTDVLQESQLMLGNAIQQRDRLVESGKALINASSEDEHQAATCMMDAAIADVESPALSVGMPLTECDRCGGWNFEARPFTCGGCGCKNTREA